MSEETRPIKLKIGTQVSISVWREGWLVQRKVGTVKEIYILNGKYEKVPLQVISISDHEYIILEEKA